MLSSLKNKKVNMELKWKISKKANKMREIPKGEWKEWIPHTSKDPF